MYKNAFKKMIFGFSCLLIPLGASADTIELRDLRNSATISVDYSSQADQEGAIRGKLKRISVKLENQSLASGFVRLSEMFSIGDRSEYPLICQGTNCSAEFQDKYFTIQYNPGGGEGERVTPDYFLTVSLFDTRGNHILLLDPIRGNSPLFLLKFL